MNMSTILKNERVIYAILIFAFLDLFTLEFCYNLGKLHTITGAVGYSVSFFLPIMPVFLMSGVLLMKQIKKQSNN